MKNVLAWLAVLALAAGCGGGSPAPEDPPEASATFGSADGAASAKQDIEVTRSSNIYLNVGYGVDNSSGQPRCNLPFSGKKCYVPNLKVIFFNVLPHDHAGCYGRFWTDAMYAAIDGWNQFHQEKHTGFQLAPDHGLPVSFSDVTIYCNAGWEDASNGGNGAYGGTRYEEEECYNLGGGKKLCRVKKATIVLGGNNILAACAADGASWDQCLRYIQNTVRHELGHVHGLGHHPVGHTDQPTLMAQYFNGHFYDVDLVPTDEEAYLMCIYNPSSGTPGTGC